MSHDTASETDREGRSEPFTLPNLLVAGCQKCGSSWLHRNLSKLEGVFGSQRKELRYFNRPHRDQASYRRNFPVQAGVRYYMESTPGYFRTAVRGIDVARNIREELGQPRIVVSFRNPIDRYESSYVHNMIEGRIPYSPSIDAVVDEWDMVARGRYAEIMRHWNAVLPEIHYVLFDDIVAEPERVIDGIVAYLGLGGGRRPGSLWWKVNDTRGRIDHRTDPWPATPKLTARARDELVDLYRDSILELGEMLRRDLSGWLDPRPA